MTVELLEIVGPALAAGLMIALTHAPLGIEVLKRGIIFIDLAIAQIAGLGLIAATTFFHHPSTWVIQSFALACTLVTAFGFRLAEKKSPPLLRGYHRRKLCPRLHPRHSSTDQAATLL